MYKKTLGMILDRHAYERKGQYLAYNNCQRSSMDIDNRQCKGSDCVENKAVVTT